MATLKKNTPQTPKKTTAKPSVPKKKKVSDSAEKARSALPVIEAELVEDDEGEYERGSESGDEGGDEGGDDLENLEGMPEADLAVAPLENDPFSQEGAAPGPNLAVRAAPTYPRVASADTLHMYLKEISKFPLLEPEEELELARKVLETGDQGAAFRLISSHLRLVVRIAMDFQRRWMQNVLDLVQEGNVGLIKAVSKFDPEKGIKFSYYAAFWIKAYILKFIMDNWRMVKIGTTQNQRKLFYNLNKERQHLINQGFDPDPAALAERLNVTPEQVVEMQQRLGSYDVSLNAPVSDDDPGSSTKMDYLPALGPGIEEVLNNKQMATLVRERLKDMYPTLSDKEQYILTNRLLSDDPVTLREIGEHFEITRERVRQIEARLLQKVRDHLLQHISDFSQDWIQ